MIVRLAELNVFRHVRGYDALTADQVKRAKKPGQRMSNVYKFDPNAIRERKRLNGKTPPTSARETEETKARKDSRRAWLLFAGAVILLTLLKAFLPL